MDTLTLTASEAWLTVLGERSAEDVVREFELTDAGPGLDEWLGQAAHEAARMAGDDTDALLEALAPHHASMLDELRAAIKASA